MPSTSKATSVRTLASMFTARTASRSDLREMIVGQFSTARGYRSAARSGWGTMAALK